MRNKKYIYASESTIEEIIYRRNGHLNHPERFHITSVIVSNLIHRLYREKPLEIPGEDWITFFKRFGKLVTITTVNLLEVLVVGVPMFLRIPKNDHKIRNKVYHDITLTTLLYRDYSRDYAEGYPIPKWGNTQLIDKYDPEIGQNGTKNLQIFARNILNAIDKKDYGLILPSIWWEISAINEYPISLLGTADNLVLRYVKAMIENKEEVDGQFISVLIEKLKNDPVGALDSSSVGLVCRLVRENGNNLKIAAKINRMLPKEISDRFPMLHNSAISANVPIRDFSILADYWDSLYGEGNIQWDVVQSMYAVCDIGTMPERYSNGLMDIGNFGIILNREDAPDQIAQWVRSNEMAASWIYTNINGIYFQQHPSIVKGFLQLLNDPTWNRPNSRSFYVHHRMLTTISTIIRTNPDKWIEEFPDLLRYCDSIDPVTISSAIKNAVTNQKEIFEAVPLRLITQTEIIRMLTIYKGFLKLNRSRKFVGDPGAPLSFRQFFPSTETMVDLFFRLDRYEYIEDIEEVEIEQELFDYLDPEFNTRQNRMKICLSRTFRYILYR